MHSDDDDDEKVTFEGPIEKGETSSLPLEPEPGQQFSEDQFKLVCDQLSDENLVSVVLPKIILSATNVVSEHSLLLLTFKAVHAPSTYKMILSAINNKIKKFELHFKDDAEAETTSVWKFHDVRIHATDFGYATRQRVETAQIAVEVSYSTITIDDVTL